MTKEIKYKETGLDWCPLIPEHWEIKRLKYLVQGRLEYGANEAAEMSEKDQPRYIRITDFSEDGSLKNETYKSLPFEVAEPYLLKQGDILFARSGATVGKTFIFWNYDGVACYAGYLIKASPNNNINPRFLYLFTKSGAYDSWKNSIFIQATIQNIGADKYSELRVPLPPTTEQQKIADYLDQKTTQIDTIIARKEKLIELLKEERTAIINQAVTKGLNPDVEMKFSGIDWLGDIPAYWELKKISRGFKKIGSGTTPKAGDIEYYEDGIYPWLQTGDLTDGYITNTSKRITQKALDDYTTLRFYDVDSLVVAMYGATIGKVGILKIRTTTNQACCVLSDAIDWNIRYLFYWFIANKEHVVRLSYGGGQPNISQEVIKALKITTPPIQEQERIIEFLDEETQRIDTIITKTEKQIELLKEYKTALINEVVTGQKIV